MTIGIGNRSVDVEKMRRQLHRESIHVFIDVRSRRRCTIPQFRECPHEAFDDFVKKDLNRPVRSMRPSYSKCRHLQFTTSASWLKSSVGQQHRQRDLKAIHFRSVRNATRYKRMSCGSSGQLYSCVRTLASNDLTSRDKLSSFAFPRTSMPRMRRAPSNEQSSNRNWRIAGSRPLLSWSEQQLSAAHLLDATVCTHSFIAVTPWRRTRLRSDRFVEL